MQFPQWAQDLNKLWWSLVEKYQKVTPPKSREKNADWASKYHMALAPVYYYSYLLGEMFASSLNELFIEQLHTNNLWEPEVGDLLKKELFSPGNRFSWDLLIEKVIKEKLTAKAWLKEFADAGK
jgi:peptidyl-dipeptidase A